ncbi:MAG: hypothetical protein ACRD0U_11965, partial [Acidimicrobiales bacterium]
MWLNFLEVFGRAWDEHRVAALEDTPDLWASVPEGIDDTGPSRLQSPVQVYRLLVELTETSRRVGGHRSAFSAYTPKRVATSTYWVEGVTGTHVWAWARGHGFPSAAEAPTAGRPPVEVRRIRQTVIERRRWPVSHTRATMNDHYLAGSADVVAESRVVVGDALREQVDRARARQTAQVFTAAFVADADRDLETAAERVGLAPDRLARLIDGAHDTVLAACTEHWSRRQRPVGTAFWDGRSDCRPPAPGGHEDRSGFARSSRGGAGCARLGDRLPSLASAGRARWHDGVDDDLVESAMTAQFVALAFDAMAPNELARFWAQALRWNIREADGVGVELVPTDATSFHVLFRPVVS